MPSAELSMYSVCRRLMMYWVVPSGSCSYTWRNSWCMLKSKRPLMSTVTTLPSEDMRVTSAIICFPLS